MGFPFIAVVRVKGNSMSPEFPDGSWILARPLGKRRNLAKDDVVLVREPGSGLLAIKRVAGVPGQELQHGEHFWALRSNEYIVLGDNLSCSRDSRKYGPLKVDVIKALVVKRLRWPHYRLPGSTGVRG